LESSKAKLVWQGSGRAPNPSSSQITGLPAHTVPLNPNTIVRIVAAVSIKSFLISSSFVDSRRFLQRVFWLYRNNFVPGTQAEDEILQIVSVSPVTSPYFPTYFFIGKIFR
jgi:hypothetical protein